MKRGIHIVNNMTNSHNIFFDGANYQLLKFIKGWGDLETKQLISFINRVSHDGDVLMTLNGMAIKVLVED